MAPQRKPNRFHLLCSICMKTKADLLVHLRRVCMKHGTPEAIDAEVVKAKMAAQEVLVSGRVFSYVLLHQIVHDADPLNRLIGELQRRHMVVTGVPPPLPNATTNTPTVQPETRGSEQSDTVSIGETFQCYRDVQWKNQARKLMAEKGLYQKHSLDHPLLKDFGTYLEKDLGNENFKQEVENVARFLFYVNPRQPSLEFVRDRAKIQQYLRELSDAKLTKQTQQNYLKSLKRFLVYHTVNTNLRHEDENLYGDCKYFMDFIGSLQKCCSKKVSKEIAKRRHRMLTDNQQLTPHDCLAVLRAAKKDFLEVMTKVTDDKGKTLELPGCILVVYYLQAVVILKHLQRPGVVEHMTVQEWIVRKTDTKGNAIVGVKEHKTAAQQVATFALSHEEAYWFDMYYTRVRPRLLNSKKRKRYETKEEERFLISTTGRPIYNASNDLNRLHKKYKLQPVTSQLARRIFETATKTLTEMEKSLVADYLTHSTATAEKHYRMKQTDAIVRASRLLATLAGDSGAESPEEGSSRGVRASARVPASTSVCGTNVKMDLKAAYSRLLAIHPVSLEGDVPNRTVRKEVSVTFQRQMYERWLKAQMRLRVQHVLAYFCRRRPTESRVRAWIAKQGWKSNLPTAANIIREWKPSGYEDMVMDSKQIQKLTSSQKWRGLHVSDIEGKGKGVIATRIFRTGEVVCDYHGRVITAKRGKDIHRNISEEGTGYMFFYRNTKGQPMCIDAHSVFCECHPEQETVGRFINHSKSAANLRSRLYTVDTDGEERDVILFLATRDIEANEELLFHYGTDRKSLASLD
ncbi:uncharacterized protein LOC117821497 isoform X2 [Notolabrus celidotus]|uniref:uncharacterized protein LOC117821497 isoform X2 n=1 Tax=Notolabrus celidotus TaxID=1203425 RepID=UPI00148FE67E|nr:uncharacterized protein LOC117821497 isoform X2 [Notolabrus celidotus]